MSRWLDLKLFASANANRQNRSMSLPLPSTLTPIGPKRNYTGSLRELIWLRLRSISGAGIRSARSLARLRRCVCVNSKTSSTNRTLRRIPQYSAPWNLAIRKLKLISLSLFKGSCLSWHLKTNLLLQKIHMMSTIILWQADASRNFSRKKFLRSTKMCIWGLLSEAVI